jgi:hypothetical protein
MKLLLAFVVGLALGFVAVQLLANREPPYEIAAAGDDSAPPLPQSDGMAGATGAT